MTAAVSGLLLRALAVRWKIFLRHLTICRSACSEQAVHDLRVAIRRLVAAIDLLSTVVPASELGTVRQQLKGALKRMGRLRDVQVQLLAVKKLSEEFPGLDAFSTVLMLRERKALGRVAHGLPKLPTRRMQQLISLAARRFKGSLRSRAVRTAAGQALQGSLAGTFLRTVEARRAMTSQDPRTIHRLRIAFKKFRYATEILSRDVERDHHKSMNDFQTIMGNIRDTEILIESIKGLKVRTPLRSRTVMRGKGISTADLARILRRLRRRHSELVREFLHSIDGLYRFLSPGAGTS